MRVKLVSGDGLEKVTDVLVNPPMSYWESSHVLTSVKLPATTYFEQGHYPIFFKTERKYEYLGISASDDEEKLPIFIEVKHENKIEEV